MEEDWYDVGDFFDIVTCLKQVELEEAHLTFSVWKQ